MSDAALQRLREDPQHLSALAKLALEDLTERPLTEALPPQWLAKQLVAAMEAVQGNDAFRKVAEQQAQEALRRVRGTDQSLEDLLPEGTLPVLSDLVATPWTPSEELTLKLLQHPATKSFLADILKSTLDRFVASASSLDNKLGGLGKRAMGRGRGVFGAAGSMFDAVRSEMGNAFESKIADFLSQGTDETLRTLAAWIADPKHADMVADLRRHVLEVTWTTPIAELAQEAEALDPQILLTAGLKWLDLLDNQPNLEATLTSWIERVQAELPYQSLGGLLDDTGLRDLWFSATEQRMVELLRHIVKGDAFASWWEALHQP